MYLKSIAIFLWLAGSWALLVFAAQTWWQAIPAGRSRMALAMAAVGFNVQHDGGHNAYSGRPVGEQAGRHVARPDRGQLLPVALEARRHPPHVHERHRRTTRTSRSGPSVRLSPRTSGGAGSTAGSTCTCGRSTADHRRQVAPVRRLQGRRRPGTSGAHRIPRPEGLGPGPVPGRQVVLLRAGAGRSRCSSTRSGWSLCFYLLITAADGRGCMSIVFQLAHCVEEAEFPLPRRRPARMDESLGRPPGRDDGRLRPRQPAAVLVARRAELPDRAPPVPAGLPRPLPGHRPDRGSRRAGSTASRTRPTPPSGPGWRRTTAGSGGWAGRSR